MLGGQGVQAWNHLGGAAQPERGGGQPFGGHQAQLVKPGGLQVCPRQAAELLERRPPPAGQRRAQPPVHGRGVIQPRGLMHLLLERPGIHRCPVQAQRIPRR